MKYFNRVMDIRRMEADLINRCLGATYRPLVSRKVEDRATLEHVVGAPVRLESGKAYGAVIKRKGGVHKGSVFVTGEAARGRGVAFVTVGGSKLIKG